MKIKNNLITSHKRVLYMFVIAFVAAIASSCNFSSRQKEEVKELKDEVDDVTYAVEEIIVTERKALKHEVDSVIDNFNKKAAAIEKEMKEGKQLLNAEKQEALTALKKQRNQLETMLEKAEKQTNESWSDFKEEMKHDTKQFAESVKDFFKDNAS